MPNLVVKEGTQLGAPPSETDEEEHAEHSEMTRKIVDLLVEMVECADILVLNKADRLAQQDLAALEDIVRQFNPMATVQACEYGKVSRDRVCLCVLCVSVSVSVPVCLSVFKFACVCVCVYIYIHVCACVRACVCVCMHTYMCVRACVHVCVYACIHT
jgi:hypothetical protein